MTSLKLPIDKLNDFISHASYITIDKHVGLPIILCVKVEISFGICQITKTNDNRFCKYTFDTDQDDISFLIPEKNLKEICLLKSTTGFIEFELDGDLILLRNGRAKQKVNCTYKTEDFPKVTKTSSNFSTRIEKDILDIIVQAKSCCGTDKIRPFFHPVYIKGDYIYSANGEMVYIKKIKSLNCDFSIQQKEIDLLKNFNYVMYEKQSNFNCYMSGAVLFGFLEPEDARGFPFETFLPQLNKDSWVEFNVEDILSFCDSAKRFVEGDKDSLGLCNSSVSLEKGEARFLYEDKSRKEECELITGFRLGTGDLFNFNINPQTWKLLLSALPYEKICIAEYKNGIYLFSENDENFHGMLAKTIIY